MPHVLIGSELVFVINSISTGEAKLKVFCEFDLGFTFTVTAQEAFGKTRPCNTVCCTADTVRPGTAQAAVAQIRPVAA